MTYLSSLSLIAGIYLLAAASPGPNFFAISQYALAGMRRLSVLAAVGVCVGSTVWAVAAMAGVTALMSRMPWLQAVIRVLGSVYLAGFCLYLLWRLTRSPGIAQRWLPHELRGTAAFRAGLVTSVTNPKSGVFWTSVFAGVLPPDPPLWFLAATAVIIAVISFTWYASVSLLMGRARVQSLYRRVLRPVDAFFVASPEFLARRRAELRRFGACFGTRFSLLCNHALTTPTRRPIP